MSRRRPADPKCHLVQGQQYPEGGQGKHDHLPPGGAGDQPRRVRRLRDVLLSGGECGASSQQSAGATGTERKHRSEVKSSQVKATRYCGIIFIHGDQYSGIMMVCGDVILWITGLLHYNMFVGQIFLGEGNQ